MHWFWLKLAQSIALTMGNRLRKFEFIPENTDEILTLSRKCDIMSQGVTSCHSSVRAGRPDIIMPENTLNGDLKVAMIIYD